MKKKTNKQNPAKRLALVIFTTLAICALAVLMLKVAITYKNLNAENRQLDVDLCMQDAESKYNFEWSRTCAAIGAEQDCLLPTQAANIINSRAAERKHDCEAIK